MKERFLLAVSWGAFCWACYWLFVFVVLAAMGNLDEFDREVASYPGSTELFWGAPLVLSPAVWLVLWIVTGSPRILPWRKL